MYLHTYMNFKPRTLNYLPLFQLANGSNYNYMACMYIGREEKYTKNGAIRSRRRKTFTFLQSSAGSVTLHRRTGSGSRKKKIASHSPRVDPFMGET
jgi:hypothetical protein